MSLFRKNLIVSIIFQWTTLLLSSASAQICPQILMATNERAVRRIEQGQSIDYGGIVLVQQFGGNLQVYTGTPGSLDCLVWESGLSEIPSDAAIYYSRIRSSDGLLFTTREAESTSTRYRAPARGETQGSYYFILNCDGTVGVYNSETPSAASAIWTEQGKQCGIAFGCTRTVVMRENDMVMSNDDPIQGEGVYMQQETNGNVIVRRGSPATPGAILWQSCDNKNPKADYFTALQPDSQFITRPVSNQNTWVWKRDSFIANPSMSWELALECNGDDFDKLVISDSTGGMVVWEDYLRPSCDAPPVCPSAVLLLDMDQRIWNGPPKGTGKGYSLLQGSNGVLELWKGEPGFEQCMLWRSAPLQRPSQNTSAYTAMQNDGNLVTYWRQFNNKHTPIWSTSTGATLEASFTFVIDNCTAGKNQVAVYRKDPRTDFDAKLLWSSEFVDSCERRDRSLRGGSEES